MQTANLTPIIGEQIHGKNVIIAGRYGDASLHLNGFVTCDPCYMPEVHDEIRLAYYSIFPWSSYDYLAHRKFWHSFEWRGQTCYARDYSDGTGAWGHCVDAGWIVAIPLALCPPRVQDLLA